MFTKILAAIDDLRHSEAVLDLVRKLATPGSTEVHVVHFRARELSGYQWYSRESKDEASYVTETALFDLRMAGLAVGAQVRPAYVDRIGQAIVAEARNFGADLIVLGSPRRGELLTRIFGDTTLRVVRRAPCPVLVASRRGYRPLRELTSGVSAPGQRS
jgi:nucleotide-binding universal stress UspA family protein